MQEIQTSLISGGYLLRCELACLYGKETQHLFKALAQQFVVRGRPPKKRRRK